jgi:hypothetical protein
MGLYSMNLINKLAGGRLKSPLPALTIFEPAHINYVLITDLNIYKA